MTHRPTPLTALLTRYAASFDAKRDALDAAWRSFAAAADEGGARALCHLAHQLAGSAGSYGYKPLGVRARSVDETLSAWIEAPPATRGTADALVARVATPMTALLAELDAARRAPR